MKTIFLRAGLLPCAVIISVFSAGLSTSLTHAQQTDAAEHSVPTPAADSMEHRGHQREMMKDMKKHHRKHMDGKLLKLDTNSDGKVDLNEFLSHSEQRFHEMDLNDDQFVTPDEARQKHQLMRQEHKKMRAKMHVEHDAALKSNEANDAAEPQVD